MGLSINNYLSTITLKTPRNILLQIYIAAEKLSFPFTEGKKKRKMFK